MARYTELAQIEPAFVSVKTAVKRIGPVTPWYVYQLCETGAIRYADVDGRRLVDVASLKSYTDSLPDVSA